MPSSQPAFSRPVWKGSLALALLLHALALGAAGLVGFTVIAERDSGPDTFELTLAPVRAPEPPPEAAFAPVAAEQLAPVSDEIALAEPELIPSEVWKEEEIWSLPPPPEPAAPVAVDLTPPDLMNLDLGIADHDATTASGVGSGASAPAPVSSTGAARGTGGTGAALGDAVGAGPAHGAAGSGGTGSVVRPLRVREAAPLETPSPDYPLLSRRAGEEGSVLCRLHLSAAGKVTEVEVVESSGFPRLDEAARKAQLGWRFTARLVEERPVASTLLHRITFKLDG